MKWTMTAPSKTFLTGEYAVLVGGPALVLNTTPRFEMIFEKVSGLGEPELRGIPPGSPAEVWLRQRRPLLEGWRLDFQDPHERRGGFGASGAQFLFCHAFTTLLQNANQSPQLNPDDIFNDYQVCSGGSGSGADLLAQLKGGVCAVDMRNIRAEALSWRHPGLAFAIVRTGIKIPTHLHLLNLSREPLQALIPVAESAINKFSEGSAAELVGAVGDYENALRGLDLQTARTTELLKTFKAQPWCLGAKGCGAWGADTILLLFEKANLAEAAGFAEAQGMPFVTTELSAGLEINHQNIQEKS